MARDDVLMAAGFSADEREASADAAGPEGETRITLGVPKISGPFWEPL